MNYRNEALLRKCENNSTVATSFNHKHMAAFDKKTKFGVWPRLLMNDHVRMNTISPGLVIKRVP